MIIKTCGLRDTNNISAVAKLALDWVGFIFYEKSPRFVGAAEELSSFLAGNESALLSQKKVGVFVNETFENLVSTIRKYDLDAVQLHGGESAVYCASLRRLFADEQLAGVRIMRAFRVSRAFDFGICTDFEGHCDYFLFDTKGQVYGGTGHKFDWSILERYKGSTPFLLSGGIGPQDAAAVLQLKHPQMIGVDVNSKFESEPGLKKIPELAAFVQEIRSDNN